MNSSKYILLLLSLLSYHVLWAQITIDKDAAIAAIQERIVLPSIPGYEVAITKFGAKGDSRSDCKMAFDKAMKHLAKRNGGTLLVPAGVYRVNGPIHFVDNVNLHLEKGAKIQFGTNPKDYLPLAATSWEGTFLYNYSPLVYAYQKKNIAITGQGAIDGEGHGPWAEWKAKEEKDKQRSREMNHNGVPVSEREFGKGHFLRPQLVQFMECSNILLEGVRFEDSPFWCVHILQSESITIRGVSYDAHNKNNDGIDLEYSKNVLIEDVSFNNSDDNIAIKAGRDHEGRANADTPSENIIIRNNTFKGLHALVIGSEMSAGVRNIFMEDNKASGYLKRGIYFKTNSDRGGLYQGYLYFRSIFKAGRRLPFYDRKLSR